MSPMPNSKRQPPSATPVKKTVSVVSATDDATMATGSSTTIVHVPRSLAVYKHTTHHRDSTSLSKSFTSFQRQR
ncbi:hypothetical protein K505DRAFT_13552 [Melanomma pulvis-pyrius CBS 109.77]|uniref:Uncharacterized protein n=1 Tax=Melanomma pulvis-pyrius CBS 109.77 TaxID=1314802 RepID=A0A6A6XG38_9PLEO|nr:hypothetical protein K505DRAFT_13552 [Melanomma pulvis-pyrius CBS 109.77]